SAARTEAAGGAAADVWLPRAGNGRPVEPFFVFRQKTQAGGIGLHHLQDFLGQRLQNGARRVGQRGGQGHERAILLPVIGRTGGAMIQLLRAKDRFERNCASWNSSLKRNVIFRISGLGHVFTSCTEPSVILTALSTANLLLTRIKGRVLRARR